MSDPPMASHQRPRVHHRPGLWTFPAMRRLEIVELSPVTSTLPCTWTFRTHYPYTLWGISLSTQYCSYAWSKVLVLFSPPRPMRVEVEEPSAIKIGGLSSRDGPRTDAGGLGLYL
jgi:hypothetical protein